MSGPSLARGKVQAVPPPSQASCPLLNLHFANFPWPRHLQTRAAHPPSLPSQSGLLLPQAPAYPLPLPFSPLAPDPAILSLWSSSFPLLAALLLEPPFLAFLPLELTAAQPYPQNYTP